MVTLGGFDRAFVQCPAGGAGLQQPRGIAKVLKLNNFMVLGTPANQGRYTTGPVTLRATQLCGLESLG
jgi:hypothetical protein